MVDTPTTNYAWIMPGDHVNTNTWGALINSDLQGIDTTVFAHTQGLARLSGTLNTAYLTKTNTAEANVVYNGVVGTIKTRWEVGIDEFTESGSNVNSDFHFNSFDDNGAFLGSPILITRATGAVTFSYAVNIQAALSVTGTVTFGSSIYAHGIYDVSGYTVSQAPTASNDATYALTNNLGATEGYFSWNHASNNVYITNVNSGASLYLNPNGSVSSIGNLNVQAPSSAPTVAGVNLVNPANTIMGQVYYDYNTLSAVLANSLTSTSFLVGNNLVSSSTTNAYKPGGGSWLVPSDERIKAVTGSYTPGLEQVLKLNPITYRYRGNDARPGEASPTKSAADRQFVGFVAQELELVMPDMVSRREGYVDGHKVEDLRDVDTSSLLFALVNCVKELKAEIEALKAAR